MKRAVGYIGDNRDTKETRSRKELIREYCLKHDMEVVEWLDDRCGSIGEVAYGDWMSGRKIDAVVIPDESVASEDVYEFYAYKAVLKRRHSDLAVAKEGHAFKAYELYLKIFDELLDTMCRIDNANQPVKRSNGRIDKAARGEYIGGRAPMGYKVVNKQLIVNPEEVPVVLCVMERKRQGKTLSGTVDVLNQNGYKTRNGKPFVISTVQSIWNNEMIYRGYRRYGDNGDWVPGQHEAIIKE